MKKAIVLMTAIVPTVGHKALVDFATEWCKSKNILLDIIISTRTFEPTTFNERVLDFAEGRSLYRRILNHADDNAPQEPKSENDKAFWDYWVNTINSMCNRVHYVISSEMYGNTLAEVLDAEHISFDTNRELIPVKGTDIRTNIISNYKAITPKFKEYKSMDIVFFGQESCGKTTISKLFGTRINGCIYIPEYARQYLETCGNSLDKNKMDNIALGQYLSEKLARKQYNALLYALDTDLLSTIGYYRLLNLNTEYVEELYKESIQKRNRFYFVMNDEIPFEEDILRYGGDKRETTKEYWIDILKEFNCKYHIVKNTDKYEQLNEISIKMDEVYSFPTTIRDFKR